MSIHNVKILWDMWFFKNKKRYVAIECLNDGEISYKRLDTMLHGAWDCDSCRKIKYLISINSRNTNVKIVDVSTSIIKLQCKVCGENFTTQSSHLDNFSCKNCRLNSYKSALEKKNCKFLEMYTEGVHDTSFVSYTNEKGEIRRVRLGHLMSGSWAAHDDECRYGPVTYLYMFSIEKETDEHHTASGFYAKIGISKKPESRMKELSIKESASIRILKEFTSRQEALVFEGNLHKYLEKYALDKHIAGSLSRRIRKNRNSSNYIKDGYTEWFYCEDKETLEKEILNGLQL